MEKWVPRPPSLLFGLQGPYMMRCFSFFLKLTRFEGNRAIPLQTPFEGNRAISNLQLVREGETCCQYFSVILQKPVLTVREVQSVLCYQVGTMSRSPTTAMFFLS